ncbi:MAG: RagB/SusD family nutrient uptake outer membrane protein [Rhizobacter sp.]|nr:RagB/SusD family nutrient uptake outer membrane protein [Ferruginibacter sp.]
MKHNFFKIAGIVILLGAGITSCTDDLNLTPTNDVTSDVVYSTPLGYKQSLAKIYGTLALTGNSGPAGSSDVFYPGSDEGQNTDFFRGFFNAQVLSTDEGITAWGDPGVPDFHNLSTSPANLFLHGVYYKSIYQVTIVNEFLRQATDERLSSKGISGAEAEAIRQYRPEVRFLRAFDYWVLMDLFGNPPFVTEENLIGGPNPQQTTRAELFLYIESELLAIDAELMAARTNEFGRVDKAAAWALLARLYLNAETYTGTARWTDAANYAKKVIDAGYTLLPNYRNLFRADNNLNNTEAIFSINYDGSKTQGFGGTTFLIKGATGGDIASSSAGMNEGWAGHRTTKALVNKFSDPSGATDKRAQFFTGGQQLEIDTVASFRDGYAVRKFINLTSTGGAASNTIHSDVDLPLFRLAEMYLIYAEAVKRGGTGDLNLAIGYINNLRTRAYGNTNGNIVSADLTLDFILDERSRELHWEGHRRTDLIRYNKFTSGDYLWPWKGGVSSGTSVGGTKALYPIPSADMNANRNLVQNPGY